MWSRHVGYSTCPLGTYSQHVTIAERTIDLLFELAQDPASGLVQIADGCYQVRKDLASVDRRTLVRAAIAALAAWGVDDPEAARAVLSWWQHYDKLTPEDRAEVVGRFTPRDDGPDVD